MPVSLPSVKTATRTLPDRRQRSGKPIHIEGVIAIAALLIAWQAASTLLPPFLFPPLQTIAAATARIFADPVAFSVVALTYLRILTWLLVTFVLATALGMAAARIGALDRALQPLIQLKQGIPGLCWAIFAIIWFEGMETRIAFVVVISTLPSFFFQARDGFRAIPRDLWNMVKALRPGPLAMLRTLILPSMVPAMLTGLRINLGAAARVTITAELISGISGIGQALRNAQEQFRMDNVLAWTLAIVLFVLVTDKGLDWLEKELLGWRVKPEAVR